MERPLIDVVFEGCGSLEPAMNGAVAVLDEAGYKFRRLVGTSAGSIAATLAAAGYTGEQIRAVSLEETAAGLSRMTEFISTPTGFSNADLLASTLGTFLQKLDFPFLPSVIDKKIDLWIMRELMKLQGFPNVYSLVEHGGFYSADGLLTWLREKLDADGRNMGGLTFGQLFARTGRHLSVVVTDTTRTVFLVLNHITAPDCPVIWGVRMSSAIPFFWPEVIWQPEWGLYQGKSIHGNVFVDGGIISNFALRLLVSDEDWVHAIMGGAPDPENQVLGLRLDDQAPVANAPPSVDLLNDLGNLPIQAKLLGRITRVLNAVFSGSDQTEAAVHPELVCHLPAKGYSVMEFNMSRARIQALMDAAGAATRAWLEQRKSLRTIGAARQLVTFRRATSAERSR